MKRCHQKLAYYVNLGKLKPFKGGWTSFERTPSLGRAKYLCKKLPLRNRQIDVYDLRKTIKRKYVL